jgi:hypothetical protein
MISESPERHGAVVTAGFVAAGVGAVVVQPAAKSVMVAVRKNRRDEIRMASVSAAHRMIRRRSRSLRQQKKEGL